MVSGSTHPWSLRMKRVLVTVLLAVALGFVIVLPVLGMQPRRRGT
jgi:hypothetical protein